MKPSIGRIVHYKNGPYTLAAIVTAVNEDGSVNLHVFEANGWNAMGVQNAVQGSANGQWDWPPRV